MTNAAGGIRADIAQGSLVAISDHINLTGTNAALGPNEPRFACAPGAGQRFFDMSAAYSPALMDFIIMVKGISNMFICGPEVIQAVTGQKCTMDEIGSPATNAGVSGNVHFLAENDADAVRLTRRILSG